MFARGRFWMRAGLLVPALLTTAVGRPATAASVPDSAEVRSAESPCLRSRPYPECRVFFVTDAGVYARLAGEHGEGPVRVILVGGAMVNLSPRNSLGASWFVNADDGLSSGPMLRWRRWLGPTRSFDVAVGTIIADNGPGRPGSVLGLVRYNPVHWFGIAARPELWRHEGYSINDASGYRVVPPGTKTRLYLGADFSGKPGLVVGSVVLAVTAIGLAAFAASWN